MKGFECKNANDYDTEPYHLLPTTIAWEDLVDPNPTVKLHLRQPVQWLNFLLCLQTITYFEEQGILGQPFFGYMQNMFQPINLF